MSISTIRFSTFPRTEPPPGFVEDVVTVFRQHENEIATETNGKGLKSAFNQSPTGRVVKYAYGYGGILYSPIKGIG